MPLTKSVLPKPHRDPIPKVTKSRQVNTLKRQDITFGEAREAALASFNMPVFDHTPTN